jgi:hypothetical protein
MVTLWVAVLVLVAAGAAAADSTPVGPLPTPAVTKVTTAKGSLVAIALPSRPVRTASSGGSRGRSTRVSSSR